MPDTKIVIAGASAWAQEVAAVLEQEGCAPLHCHSTAGYVARLVDDGAAMILVAGEDAHWAFWTTTPKSSPASRRIPVVVVAEDAGRRAEAILKGADLALTSASLIHELPTLLKTLARVPDATLAAQLDCQCQEPMPPEGMAAIALFNAGKYYEQHDQFEAMWMAERGPVRDLYRAVLQVGVAYYQIRRGNARGAHKMLLRSLQWLALLPDECRSIDVARFCENAAMVRKELERVGEQGMADFDLSLLRGVPLVERDQGQGA